VLIHLPDETASQGYIEIVAVTSGNRVITVIEILSQANKERGEGQDLYLRKQRELKQGHVSLVEIDLLRGGERVLAVPVHKISPSHRTTCQICVRRGLQPDICEVYAVPLRQRLSRFKVPLRERIKASNWTCKPCWSNGYRNGRYYTIDYRIEAKPPLRGEDAVWADEILRQAGRR